MQAIQVCFNKIFFFFVFIYISNCQLDLFIYTLPLIGKLLALVSLLHQIKKTTADRVVIVSYYTKTLDLLEKLCQEHEFQFVRLDGSTLATKRQPIVDRFNDKNSSDCTYWSRSIIFYFFLVLMLLIYFVFFVLILFYIYSYFLTEL